MKTTKAISTISKIKEHANSFIMQSLAQHGVHGLVPSHGGILVVLFHKQWVIMKYIADTIDMTKRNDPLFSQNANHYAKVELCFQSINKVNFENIQNHYTSRQDFRTD